MTFRKLIQGTRLEFTGGLFPVQVLSLDGKRNAVWLQRALRRAGVRTAVVNGDASCPAKLIFVINASHSAHEIDLATRALKAVIQDSALLDLDLRAEMAQGFLTV